MPFFIDVECFRHWVHEESYGKGLRVTAFVLIIQLWYLSQQPNPSLM